MFCVEIVVFIVVIFDSFYIFLFASRSIGAGVPQDTLRRTTYRKLFNILVKNMGANVGCTLTM